MSNRTFSVAMAVYKNDDPVHFRLALDSIMHQTVPPDEVVLVIDGPIPAETEAVVADCAALPIFHIIRLEENCGHGIARRTGLSACRHELVALMDADDISCPDRFEKQLAVMAKDPDLSIVGGCISEFIGEPENAVSLRDVCLSNDAIQADLKKRCPMNQMTVMFRKSDVERAGGYLDFYCEEDYYLWVRMCLAGMKFANLPDVLVHVRVGEDMYRRRGGWRYFKSEAALQKLMRKERLISLPRYLLNVSRRFVVQVLMPAPVRGFVFRHFARRAPKTK